MRSFLFQAALLFASANAVQMLSKRQTVQEDGAFVPDTTTVDSCADAGPGYLDCGTEYCYSPGLGETCCTEGYFCDPGSFCLGGGLCCPTGMTETECLSQNGLTAVPTFFNAAATSESEARTAAATGTTTRRATITGGSSSATETADSSNGGGSNLAGLGAVLAAMGVAALAL